MDNLIGFPEGRLRELFAEWQEKPFRVFQLLTWVYRHRIFDIDAMTNFSKELRSRLKDRFHIALPKIESKTRSRDDTIKYLFRLEDGSAIESVWMPSENRTTLCISTQVGCRLACAFCLTGTLGIKRNLSAAEIVGQIMAVEGDLPKDDHPSNIVIMGMGEPLDNYDATVEAARLMSSPHALKISGRKITLSTSGLLDKLEKLKGENLNVNLAISLNATDNETRSRIMPINKKYPIEALLECLRTYPLKPTRRITFEYVLIRGLNDTHDDAMRLAKLLRGIPSKINLIPFNPFDKSDFQPPDEATVAAFHEFLMSKNYAVFVRKNRGSDILGACGQLAAQAFEAAASCYT